MKKLRKLTLDELAKTMPVVKEIEQRNYVGGIRVDLLAHKFPLISGYTAFNNNPIQYIDPDGAFPFTFHIRAFAPFQSFGFGFHGDNRGFTTSTASNVTSRVAQSFTLETDNGSITGGTPFSSPSSHPLTSTKTGIPTGGVELLSSSFGDGVNQFSLASEFAGANPLTPEDFTPSINVFSNLSITENREEGFLNISGALTGDNFPSTEAFITDPSGQSLFLGVGFLTGGRNTGPFTELEGDNKDRAITDFNLRIGIDADGNFQNVIFNGTEFSIQDFNKIFERSNPLEESR